MIPNRSLRWPVATALVLASILSGCSARESAPAEPATAVSVTPASGAGAKAAFTIRFTGPAGSGAMTDVRLLVNSELNGAKACYVYYDFPSNSLLLVNDLGDGSTRAAVGSGKSVENGQCQVTAEGASVVRSGGEITATIPVTFKPAFAGAKDIYLYATTSAGANTGLVKKGAWTVPSK